MGKQTLRQGAIASGFLLAVAILAGGVWRYGYLQALDQLARRAAADLALASDRLSAQLQTYQELAVLTATHPALERLDVPGRAAAASAMLLEVADKTAAMDVAYADASGRILADATGRLDRDVSGMPWFRRAMQGALGSGEGEMGPRKRRAYIYAAPAFGANGQVRGALVFVADVEQAEQVWRGGTPAVFFTDGQGRVFVTNRSEILGWHRSPGGSGLVPPQGAAPPFSARRVGGHELWQIDWGPYLPQRALHLARSLPVVGLTGAVLADATPARRLAALQAATVAAICLAFGALLFVATVRRRTLAEANAALEARVAGRTAELSAANARLRREVAERQEAEAALKKVQADLVQAGKLSALGQMTAGISHELNQPLMAIQSFAENGAQFLQRGRPEKAGENLSRISDLARRMGRIIRNLRAFARQESEPASRVDVVTVLDGVIEMVEARLAAEDVRLRFDRPGAPVWVRGGEVRLGQVFLNLIGNAIDAMDQVERRVLEIALRPGDETAVDICDTGPGIDDPERMFDPFYTTKAVGAAEGVGLGLSISYGIVQSFGGDIRGRNRRQGGACFTVRLEPWSESERAA